MATVHAGMVFDPNDVEIVSYYLPKLIANGGNVVAVLGDFSYVFKVSDVYSCKPWLLFANDEPVPFMKSNQRFVFSPRQKIARKNCNGKRPRRGVQGSESEGEGGFWKSSTGDKPILDDNNGQVIGYSNMLNFYEYNINSNSTQKKNRKDGTRKTSWLMYEYRLGGDKFQEWVICKIKDTLRPETDQYEAVWLQHLFLKDDQTAAGKMKELGRLAEAEPVRNNGENGKMESQLQGCSCPESDDRMSLNEGSCSDKKSDGESGEGDTNKGMMEVDEMPLTDAEIEEMIASLIDISSEDMVAFGFNKDEAVRIQHLFKKDDQTGKMEGSGRLTEAEPVRNNNENEELKSQLQGCSCAESDDRMSLHEGSCSDKKDDHRESEEGDINNNKALMKANEMFLTEAEIDDMISSFDISKQYDLFPGIEDMLAFDSSKDEDDPFSEIDILLDNLP